MTENKRFLCDYSRIYQQDIENSQILTEISYEQAVDLLNELIKENEQLKSENKNLKSNVDDLMDMELEDRDIVCMAGKFRLEEWGKHRLHQFYDGDTPLEDETVVMRLLDLTRENEQLKQFQDRVFSWIDMHLQRLPTLRDDEFESDDEFADPSLYSGAMQILETMKKELKGDVE